MHPDEQVDNVDEDEDDASEFGDGPMMCVYSEQEQTGSRDLHWEVSANKCMRYGIRGNERSSTDSHQWIDNIWADQSSYWNALWLVSYRRKCRDKFRQRRSNSQCQDSNERSANARDGDDVLDTLEGNHTPSKNSEKSEDEENDSDRRIDGCMRWLFLICDSIFF